VLAGVVSAQGQPGLAARLYGALETLRELTGAARLPTAEEAHVRWVKAAQAELGPDRFQVAWDDGRATPLDRLLAEAIDDRPAPGCSRDPPSSPPTPISAICGSNAPVACPPEIRSSADGSARRPL